MMETQALNWSGKRILMDFVKVIKTIFKGMIDALMGKVEEPRASYGKEYSDLEEKIISVRKELAQSMSTQIQLERRLEEINDSADEAAASEELKESIWKIQVDQAKKRNELAILEPELQNLQIKLNILDRR